MQNTECIHLIHNLAKLNPLNSAMKNITILVPKGAILGSIEGPRQVLTAVNGYLASIGKPPVFNIELVGLTNETPLINGMYTIRTDKVIADVTATDLVIIPALDGDVEKSTGGKQRLDTMDRTTI